MIPAAIYVLLLICYMIQNIQTIDGSYQIYTAAHHIFHINLFRTVLLFASRCFHYAQKYMVTHTDIW